MALSSPTVCTSMASTVMMDDCAFQKLEKKVDGREKQGD